MDPKPDSFSDQDLDADQAKKILIRADPTQKVLFRPHPTLS
jgi:hypothetical protein